MTALGLVITSGCGNKDVRAAWNDLLKKCAVNDLGWTPPLRQPVNPLFAVRWKSVERPNFL